VAPEGVSGYTPRGRDTFPARRGRKEEMETKLSRLSELSGTDRQMRFTSLIHLINEANLKVCYWELKRNKAPGVDWVDWNEYGQELDENIRRLVERMRTWEYRPQAVRRVYIPKANGGKRPLGIPALEDKIVQSMVTRILVAIYEPLFLECSYGFRPGRSAHSALRVLNRELYRSPSNWVVDADIRGFFDQVDHRWLVTFLEEKIADKNLIRLIVRFLKAGIMDADVFQASEKGTPQGGILSPVLANIYLHDVLDRWFIHGVKKKINGYCALIRYADDFIILTRYEKDALLILNWLMERLREFGLELSADKTRLIEFGRFAEERSKRKGKRPGTFDFLGFTHYITKSRTGGFKVGRRTAKGKYRGNLKRMNEWLKVSRHRMPVDGLWKLLTAKLNGYYRYYGVSDNYGSLARYSYQVTRLVFKWLNRRSQRSSYTWEAFNKYLERYPLPQPRIYTNLHEYA
jgi:RNA-directed DNA polymerase